LLFDIYAVFPNYLYFVYSLCRNLNPVNLGDIHLAKLSHHSARENNFSEIYEISSIFGSYGKYLTGNEILEHRQKSIKSTLPKMNSKNYQVLFGIPIGFLIEISLDYYNQVTLLPINNYDSETKPWMS
jgi:hypothetical protein